jgi:hypothetical protein
MEARVAASAGLRLFFICRRRALRSRYAAARPLPAMAALLLWTYEPMSFLILRICRYSNHAAACSRLPRGSRCIGNRRVATPAVPIFLCVENLYGQSCYRVTLGVADHSMRPPLSYIVQSNTKYQKGLRSGTATPKRNDATAPKIKAGAAACDITSCSWSIVGRLDNIATSRNL